MSTRILRVACLLVFVFVCAMASAQNTEFYPGRNINMVSGTKLPGGDPYLQRQNEPSLAVRHATRCTSWRAPMTIDRSTCRGRRARR